MQGAGLPAFFTFHFSLFTGRMSDNRPGKGLFGWLGRQFGHIKKAVQTDPAKPGPKVVYRENRTEEQQFPDQPGMKFRRTVIDEVIVDGAAPKRLADVDDGKNQGQPT